MQNKYGTLKIIFEMFKVLRYFEESQPEKDRDRNKEKNRK